MIDYKKRMIKLMYKIKCFDKEFRETKEQNITLLLISADNFKSLMIETILRAKGQKSSDNE